MGAAEVSIRAMEGDDLDPLFELYKEVVADGGAVPADGEPTIDVFVEGWIRNRSVFVAWRDGEAVGTYFVRSHFPAFAAHIATSSPDELADAVSARSC